MKDEVLTRNAAFKSCGHVVIAARLRFAVNAEDLPPRVMEFYKRLFEVYLASLANAARERGARIYAAEGRPLFVRVEVRCNDSGGRGLAFLREECVVGKDGTKKITRYKDMFDPEGNLIK